MANPKDTNITFEGEEKPSKGFTVISLSGVEDTNLSWEAKGLLTYLISRARIPGWILYKNDLLKRSNKCRKDKLDKILAELKEYGYLEINNGRNKKGQWVYDWILRDKPSNKNKKPDKDLPHTDKPVTVEPDTVNTHIYVNNNSNIYNSNIYNDNNVVDDKNLNLKNHLKDLGFTSNQIDKILSARPNLSLEEIAQKKRWIDMDHTFSSKKGALYKALLEDWDIPQTVTMEKLGYDNKRHKREEPAPWLEDT